MLVQCFNVQEPLIAVLAANVRMFAPDMIKQALFRFQQVFAAEWTLLIELTANKIENEIIKTMFTFGYHKTHLTC